MIVFIAKNYELVTCTNLYSRVLQLYETTNGEKSANNYREIITRSHSACSQHIGADMSTTWGSQPLPRQHWIPVGINLIGLEMVIQYLMGNVQKTSKLYWINLCLWYTYTYTKKYENSLITQHGMLHCSGGRISVPQFGQVAVQWSRMSHFVGSELNIFHLVSFLSCDGRII